MAIEVLKAHATQQVYFTTRRKCANGCGDVATVYDIACRKHLCWFHLIMEHNILTPNKIGAECVYIYYGP